MFNISLMELKKQYGSSNMGIYYENIIRRNRRLALKLLDDDSLDFLVFYKLIPSIVRSGLYKYVSDKNKMAIKIYAKADNNDNLEKTIDSIFNPDEQLYYDTLKWIVNNYENIKLDNNFDKVIDVSYNLLLLKYKDTTYIDDVIKTIFNRCKDKKFYADLVWGLFQLKDYTIIEKIIPYLHSDDENQVNLSKKLLNANEIENTEDIDKYVSYLESNKGYITFTDQVLNSSSCPSLFNINLEKKYLRDNSNLTPIQKNNLDKFKDLDNITKSNLSNFSENTYHRNKRLWRTWSNLNINYQIEICNKEGKCYD